jgi:predicted MFS family arabinose efflux permease
VRLGALVEREFRLLFLGRTISLLGSAIAPIALAFAVLDDLDGSPADLGFVLFAASVPQVLFLLVGGVFADRLRRDRVLVGTDLAMFAAQAAAAVLLLAGAAQLWHLALLQVVRGTAQAFFFPASTGLVPETVSAPRLQQANALLRLAFSSTSVLGAALGGGLVAGVGAGWALAFDAATFLGSAAFLSALRLGPKTLPARRFLGELRDGWSEFWSRTWLWSIVAGAAFANMAFQGGFAVLGPVVAARELGGAAAWGAIAACEAAGFVVGGVLMLRLRPSRPLLAACAALFLVIPQLALLALAAPVVAIAGVALLGGLGLEVFGVLWDTTLQREIPGERLSRVSSYDYFGSFVLNPVGLALAGPLAEAIGTAEAMWVATAVVFAAIAPLPALPGVRSLTYRSPASAPSTASR